MLDTEVLFAADPKDRHHDKALKLFASRTDIVAPDTALLEFAEVLKTMGVPPPGVRRFVLALDRALSEQGVRQGRTICAQLLARQCELETRIGMTYFDSLIAASALALDGTVVSDDKAFDDVPGLRRIPLGQQAQ